MRWRRRIDDARRMKGDPPPTVDQLLVTVRQQGEAIRYLQDRLRAATSGLGNGICGDEGPVPIGCASMRPVCELRYGHASEWHEGDTGGRWRKMRRPEPQLTPLAVDEDVARPYIPNFERREQPWTEER